jgi:hypothetical protein
MEENHFDILFAQEANVDCKHKTTWTYFERMLKQKYHITVSETPFRSTTIIKPGGTFVITGTPLKSRIVNKISDEAGRWAGNVIILKNNKKSLWYPPIKQWNIKTQELPWLMHSKLHG